jgi:hypothetical protein
VPRCKRRGRAGQPSCFRGAAKHPWGRGPTAQPPPCWQLCPDQSSSSPSRTATKRRRCSSSECQSSPRPIVIQPACFSSRTSTAWAFAARGRLVGGGVGSPEGPRARDDRLAPVGHLGLCEELRCGYSFLSFSGFGGAAAAVESAKVGTLMHSARTQTAVRIGRPLSTQCSEPRWLPQTRAMFSQRGDPKDLRATSSTTRWLIVKPMSM